MANSADPDQLASEANWSGSTLFAKQGISGFSRIRVNICMLGAREKENTNPHQNMCFIIIILNNTIIIIIIIIITCIIISGRCVDIMNIIFDKLKHVFLFMIFTVK